MIFGAKAINGATQIDDKLSTKNVNQFTLGPSMRHTQVIPAVAFALATCNVQAEVKSLCEKQENTVWSCEARSKVYSVCASRDLDSKAGYLQYRAGTTRRIEFKYPAVLVHPKGRFEFGMLARGTWLRFTNGAYTYEINEEVIGQPSIEVSKEDRFLSRVECSDSTQSLTLTSTINVFKGVGIFK